MLQKRAPWHVLVALLAVFATGANGDLPASRPVGSSGSDVFRSALRPSTTSRAVHTRTAIFEPAAFSELPGWQEDDFTAAWAAFRRSCIVLAKRVAWGQICARAGGLDASPALRRAFFEEEFEPFQIVNPDRTQQGTVTGYYEPRLRGSQVRTDVYSVPVYGTPRDLYTLDWKHIPEQLRQGEVHVVRSAGQTLAVVPRAGPDSYGLNVGALQLDTRDRVLRLRLVGRHALPYLTRAEIRHSIDAPVLAYVEEALSLYAMQIQGSGRILLTDGRELRLRYAQQNGHPFRPLRVRAKEAPRSRGLTDAGDTESFELEEVASTGGDGSRSRSIQAAQSDAANALVEALLNQRSLREKRVGNPQAPGTLATVPQPRPLGHSSSGEALLSDPSYVFFQVEERQSPETGPIGALGVSLTAGRSIAVDPRVSPLGYPVYVSLQTNGAKVPATPRLVVAQDTGGAIRGAVRADLFFGTGPDAGRQASQTLTQGSMWLLVPKSEANRLRGEAPLSRGLEVDAQRPSLGSDCVIADDVFCSNAN